jgi:hypothetical protein
LSGAAGLAGAAGGGGTAGGGGGSPSRAGSSSRAGSPSAAGSSSTSRADPLAGIVFALLVLACFAAFAITQHLKHTPTAVQRFQMTPYLLPTASGRRKVEHLSFRIAQAGEVTVAIVDSSGRQVATLLRDRPLARYHQLSFEWDGHRGPTTPPAPAAGTPHDPLLPIDHGALAPAGEYRVSVSLRNEHRPAVLSPRSFTLR